MIKSARKLKTLLLPNCNGLTDEILSTILNLCKEIGCLDVSSRQITDQSLISIAQLNSLVRLSLKNTRVTDEGIRKLLTGCTKLAFLNVDDCSSVSIATLYDAHDLISQGALNKELMIRVGGKTIPINTWTSRRRGI
ncbi:F-box and leucine-rich repeat protein 13-like [Brevipalpus obovatus]|uniref:F-box and leucine-rich repeat protein 13-like n=1 Tax=Brevipalpus obovatus TaxID=246614 RepID=UPI003D9E9946